MAKVLLVADPLDEDHRDIISELKRVLPASVELVKASRNANAARSSEDFIPTDSVRFEALTLISACVIILDELPGFKRRKTNQFILVQNSVSGGFQSEAEDARSYFIDDAELKPGRLDATLEKVGVLEHLTDRLAPGQPSPLSIILVEEEVEKRFSSDQTQSALAALEKRVIEAVSLAQTNVICLGDGALSARCHTTKLGDVEPDHDLVKVLYEEAHACFFADHFQPLAGYFHDGRGPRAIAYSNAGLLMLSERLNQRVLETIAADPTEYYGGELDRLHQVSDASDTALSIIIPHYNTQIDLLERAVRSAQAIGTRHPLTEVIVVDDGSKEDVEAELRDRLGGDRQHLTWLYQENAGLGPARNAGIKAAKGEYLFFLDSDDTLDPDGVRRLLTHCCLHDLDVSAGIRLRVHSDGSFIAESFSRLFQGVVTRHVRNGSNAAADDFMATNKLYRRQVFFDHDLWFPPILYEDGVTTNRLHNAIRSIDYVSFPVHSHYYYGEGTTLSSHMKPSNFKARMDSIDVYWNELSNESKTQRLSLLINGEAGVYLEFSSSQAQEIEYYELFRCFLKDKRPFLDSTRKGRTQWMDLAIYAAKGHRGRFLRKVKRIKTKSAPALDTYDNYFVDTHYHLILSLLRTLDTRKKSRLILNGTSLRISRRRRNRIKRLGIWSEVISFRDSLVRQCGQALFLKGTGAKGEVLTRMESYYRSRTKHFSNDDTAICFNHQMMNWYFINRSHAQIVKIEDGYGSMEREPHLLSARGVSAWIFSWMGDAYPQCPFASEKVVKLISSKPLATELFTGEFNRGKIEIRDPFDSEARNDKEFRKAISSIYWRRPRLPRDSHLILTQPLYERYCDQRTHENVVLYMIHKYGGSRPFIKPHPRDNTDYKAIGVPVLKSKAPVEVLNFAPHRIAALVTFNSSGGETNTFADETVVLFRKKNPTEQELSREIERIGRLGEEYRGLRVPKWRRLIRQLGWT